MRDAWGELGVRWGRGLLFVVCVWCCVLSLNNGLSNKSLLERLTSYGYTWGLPVHSSWLHQWRKQVEVSPDGILSRGENVCENPFRSRKQPGSQGQSNFNRVLTADSPHKYKNEQEKETAFCSLYLLVERATTAGYRAQRNSLSLERKNHSSSSTLGIGWELGYLLS